jgi:cytoskeletal protein RodZ
MAKSQSQEMKANGQFLKEIRTEKGLSLESVHEVTKIPLDVLQAIEEGYMVRTLSPFYLKGFMKMYAKYLGADINQVVIPEAKEPQPEPIRASLPLKNRYETEENWENLLSPEVWQAVVKIGLALFVLFLLFRISSCINGKVKSRSGKQQGSVSKTQEVGKTTALEKSSGKETESPKPKSQETNVPSPQVTVKEQKESKEHKDSMNAPASIQSKTAPPTTAAVQAAEKEVHLTVKAQSSGWLQVKVDGILVFRSSLAKGAVESWQADKEIELSGKGIHSLEYELNGKVLGPLGRTDRSARRVIFTKNGLVVNP